MAISGRSTPKGDLESRKRRPLRKIRFTTPSFFIVNRAGKKGGGETEWTGK